VAEITAAANRILESRGELVELKPRAMGDLLRNLGFPTKRLGAERRGFTLLNSVRKRIHDLALSHKLLDIPNQSVSCSLCKDMFPPEDAMDNERELRRRPETLSDEEIESMFAVTPRKPGA
jgi:hypothetical protein